MKILYFLSAFITWTFPSLAFAAPHTFQELAGQITGILNATTAVLIVAGVAIYFWGISTNILKFGEDREKFRNYFLWGIIVLFVMVSIWGIVYLVQNTLFGGSSGNTTNPTGGVQQTDQFAPVHILN